MIIISLMIMLGYLSGWGLTTRRLFCRWRPYREPVCGRQHSTYDYGTGKSYNGKHEAECYRSRRLDLTYRPYDRDGQAMGNAAGLALLWPFVLLFQLLLRNPPERPAEAKIRRERAEKRVAELEAQLGAPL